MFFISFNLKWLKVYWRTRITKWIFTDKDGDEYKVSIKALFCRDHNLNESCMDDVIRGSSKQHRGWKARRI